jgi:hypothetical protein
MSQHLEDAKQQLARSVRELVRSGIEMGRHLIAAPRHVDLAQMLANTNTSALLGRAAMRLAERDQAIRANGATPDAALEVLIAEGSHAEFLDHMSMHVLANLPAIEESTHAQG